MTNIIALELLRVIIAETNNENVATLTTKEIAEKFNVDTKTAYNELKKLHKAGEVIHMEAPNGDNFACAHWTRAFKYEPNY